MIDKMPYAGGVTNFDLSTCSPPLLTHTHTYTRFLQTLKASSLKLLTFFHFWPLEQQQQKNLANKEKDTYKNPPPQKGQPCYKV